MSAELSAESIATLVNNAFILDVTVQKDGLVGPTQHKGDIRAIDFMLAGSNSAPYFARQANDYRNGITGIFNYLPAALEASQMYRSSQKVINLGLLELMFLCTYARLQCDNPHQIHHAIGDVLSDGNHADVEKLIEARRIAWATSKRNEKDAETLPSTSSVLDFYSRLASHADESTRQWGGQMTEGLPTLQTMYLGLTSAANIPEALPRIYAKQREKHPNMKKGILADMLASATFLVLSYQR